MRKLFLLLLCCCLIPFPAHAAENEKLVCLTFDDGPSGRFTRRLLEGLATYDVKATFFLCGYRLEQYPTLAQRICDEGHEIGLHGFSHDSMKTMCRRTLTQELQKTLSLLPQDCNVAFVRPPGGSGGGCTERVAKELGLSILYWSVDPKDWAVHDAATIEKAILRRVQDGDIILLHDMSDSSVDAALSLIPKLQKQGFRFVTASELAQAKGITPLAGNAYFRFDADDAPK